MTDTTTEVDINEEVKSDILRYVLPRIKTDISELTDQKLITARVDLVRAYQFLGYIVMSTEYHFSDDIPTMAATTIGGNKVYINEKFVNETLKNRAQRSFVIAHEILHIFLEHIGRQTEAQYDPKLWNVATDFCINSFLNELNSSKLEMPSFGLYDSRFKSMGADEIYHILLEEADGNAGKAAEQYGAGKDPNDMDDDGQCPMDEVSGEPMSDAQKIENQQKMATAIGQMGEDAIKQMGDGAADLVRAFEDIFDSKIPWQSLLREFVTESAKSRYTYNRISRRSSGRVLFPSMTGEHIKILFGIDTSGSMSTEDLKEAMTELHSIIEEYDSWEVELLSCDTGAHVIGEYCSEDGDDWTTIDKNLIGGGGTDMAPMIEHGNEQDEPANAIIIVTDGYVPEETMDEAVDDIPVITIVTSAGNPNLQLEHSLIIQMTDF